MKVSVAETTDEETARAIAEALAARFEEDVTVVSTGDEELGGASYDGDSAGTEAEAEPDPDPDLGPTEREAQLWEAIEEIDSGGKQKYKDQLPEQGKKFVRDRLELWFGDDGFLFEDGKFAEFDADDVLPADGLITGGAEFEGRDVHFMANDYTVKRGSMTAKGVEKFLRMQERRPASAVSHGLFGRADRPTDRLFRQSGGDREVLLQPLDALGASTPDLRAVRPLYRWGGVYARFRRFHRHGSGDEFDGDRQPPNGGDGHRRRDQPRRVGRPGRPRELVAQLVGYLPENSDEDPPQTEGKPPARPPDEIDGVIPQEPNRGYDMVDLIDRVVDADSWFELRPEYGKEILTGFARIDGRSVGIVANQPAHRAGAIFPDAAEKAAEFIWTCDAYNVPLLYLTDTPGFMAGSGVEKEGILEQGKKMIYATSSATVPKQCVVVRKAYGAGIYAMSGPAYDPESTLALPSGEIAIMGPEAAINAVYARKLAEIDDEEERKQTEKELREEFRENIDARRMASEVVIDEVVPPSTLREELANRFAFYEGIEKELPDKKHGTVL